MTKLIHFQPPPESAHDLKKHLRRANVKIRELQGKLNSLTQKYNNLKKLPIKIS